MKGRVLGFGFWVLGRQKDSGFPFTTHNRLPTTAALAALFLAGCAGGSGGVDGPADGEVQVQVNVDFAGREARIDGGESAQSVRIAFTGEEDGAEVTFDRTDSGRPTVNLRPGEYNLTAEFKSGSDGAGDTVATAAGTVRVRNSGVLGESIVTEGKVASVTIDPDLTPNLFPTVSALGLNVRDADGNLLAVRGDACDLIAGEAGSLMPRGNGYSALFEGTMSLRASTDGVLSNTVRVDTQRSSSSGGVVTPNYASSSINLGRWEIFPLTVRFIRTGEWRSDLEARFREGMEDWRRRTDNEVRFLETNSESANLTVSFVKQSTLGGDTIGLTSYRYRDTSSGRIHTDADIDISSDYGSPTQVRAICAHELGHALGIEGHSPDRDLMYFQLGGIFNQRDVNTLRTAYKDNFSLTRSIRMDGPIREATISCPK